MNTEDEEEYEEFYDFTKTYENHPLLIKQTEKPKRVRKEGDQAADGEADEAWEDVDFESADEDDIEDDGEEVKGDKKVDEEAKTNTVAGDSEQIDTTTTTAVVAKKKPNTIDNVDDEEEEDSEQIVTDTDKKAGR